MDDGNQPLLSSRLAAVGAVAGTYFYFLIFAEFALLTLARPFATGSGGIRPALTALGGAGVAGSFAGALWFKPARARRLLAWFFRSAALGAVLTTVAASASSFLAACGLVGFSLGGLTVVVSASLLAATGPGRLGLCVGAGTGLAYGCANLPTLFNAAPGRQAIAAALVTLGASFLGGRLRPASPPPTATSDYRGRTETVWIVIFLVLVVLDSAAFYLIQHAPALRGGTWGDVSTLRSNAAVHLLAALLAGWAFDRGWRSRLIALAMGFLTVACLSLSGPAPATPTALLYAAGVSFYSVVLVAYPARAGRPWVAARVFALAGWIGSAVGIALVLSVAVFPPGALLVAVVLLGCALVLRRHFLRAALAAGLLLLVLPRPARADAGKDATLRGREVYIAEGCINCHSQYIRPEVAADIERWGPASSLKDVLTQSPPLIGNRREGPDLANVGLRRSPEWNRLHLLTPRAVSPGSVMPSYARLFAAADSRGPDLLIYLASLGRDQEEERSVFVARWRPATTRPVLIQQTRVLFAALCAPCHGATGQGDGILASRLRPCPPDWTATDHSSLSSPGPTATSLARIIKFGLPGTSMAGHELLSDDEAVGLARLVQSLQHSGTVGPSP